MSLGISEDQDVLATARSDISLLCNASGHPELEYSWERASIPFDSIMDDEQDRISGLLSSTLTIANVGVADAMDYICSVSLYGEIIGNRTISLEVQGELVDCHSFRLL